MRELNREEIDRLLETAPIARIAMVGPEGPYVIPMPFYFDGSAFYMRLPDRGRKSDCLGYDPRVCIEVDGYTDDLRVYWSVIADCRLEKDTPADLIENIRELNQEKYEKLRGAARKGHGRPKAAPGQSGVRRFMVTSLGGRRSDSGEIDLSNGHTAKNASGVEHAVRH